MEGSGHVGYNDVWSTTNGLNWMQVSPNCPNAPNVWGGTWAFLEIGDSDLFAKPLPTDCVASAFANRELYVVLANYSQLPVRQRVQDFSISSSVLPFVSGTNAQTNRIEGAHNVA